MDINMFLYHIRSYQNRAAVFDGTKTCTYNELLKQILRKAALYRQIVVGTYLLVSNNTIDIVTTFLAMVAAEKSVFMVSNEDKKSWAEHNLPGLNIDADPDQYGAYAVRGSIPSEKIFLLTSGTTKAKRAVQLRFSQIVDNAVNALSLYPLIETDIVLSILPLNHVFGLVSLLASLISGVQIGIGIKAANTLLRYSNAPLVLHSVPRVLLELLPMISKSSARQVLSAGAALSPNIAEQFQQYGIVVYEAYGMTETAGAVAIGPFGQMKVLTHMDAFVFDGEIYVGGTLMEGYWGGNPPEECLATGDLGEVLPWDILQLTGRKKELLVFDNGEKLHPTVLEDVVYRKCINITECEAYQNSVGQLEVDVYAPYKEIDLRSLLEQINLEVPHYARISRITQRNTPFPHTESGKLKRRIPNGWKDSEWT